MHKPSLQAWEWPCRLCSHTACPRACPLSTWTPLPQTSCESTSNPRLCCVLCSPHPRCPRRQQTSWPTVKPTCGRTLSSSRCLRQKTLSERRSSSVPSSDSPFVVEMSPFLSIKPLVETAHALSFREPRPHPAPPNQD